MTGSEDNAGVGLSEAPSRYCHPDIYSGYLEAGRAANWSKRRIRSTSSSGAVTQSAQSAAVPGYSAAERLVAADIRAKLRDHRLFLKGFVEGPPGRDPSAPRQRIPDDVLKAKDLKLNWRAEEVSGIGLKFVGVRVYSCYEDPDYPKSLVGLSLAVCFKQMVIDDWVRLELEEFAFEAYPKWKFDPASYEATQHHRWPVRFENWRSAAKAVKYLRFPPITYDEDEPDPPEVVVRVRIRLETQIQTLLGWFRGGVLQTDGVKKTKDGRLAREAISPEWYRQDSAVVNTKDSKLYDRPSKKRQPVYSDIGIAAPKPKTSDTLKQERGSLTEQNLVKGKGGRKDVWDWDGAIRELLTLANSKDGLPPVKARVEEHIQEWFIQQTGDGPNQNTIRRKLFKYLPLDYYADK